MCAPLAKEAAEEKATAGTCQTVGTSAVSFCHLVPWDSFFQTRLQIIEGMEAFTFGARAHQASSDGETISNDGSQSMGDCGTQPKIPQVQFLEPNNNQTSAQPFPEYQYCWESGGKATVGVRGSWKISVTRPRGELHPCQKARHYGRSIAIDAEERRREEIHS